jgi:hypothetical protein
MGKEKRFFAQTPPGQDNKASYFHTLDEARVWIADNGGGSIKMRDTGAINSGGIGLGKADFEPPSKVWHTLETWPAMVREKSVAAVSPLQQTFLDVRADTAMSGHDLSEFELVETVGSALFRACCQVCGRSVEVTQKGVIYSLLGDGRCRGHE